MRGAGGLDGLDPVFDLGVVTVEYFQGGDVRVGLVGDEALEAMPVQMRLSRSSWKFTVAAVRV